MNKLCVIFLGAFVSGIFCFSSPSYSKEDKFDDCWNLKYEKTLLDTVLIVMQKPIEEEYRQHDFIQTFGCAYEEDDIEQNSIRAVYRAVIQSLRNRKVTIRDDLDRILQSKPPRPDNLARDYSMYVNIPSENAPKSARYEIRILDLEVVPTIESSKAVWTRIVTRYAYKEDFNIAPPAEDKLSEFVKIMEIAQTTLKETEKRKFKNLRKILDLGNVAIHYPKSIEELIFGDSITLFDEIDPEKTYMGIFLGKGIYTCETQEDGMVICKFGEERLFRLRIDNNSFRRTKPIFAELNYEAPESILQCLYLKFCHEKPRRMPTLNTFR